MSKSTHKPLTPREKRVIQAELREEQAQAERQSAWPTLQDMRDWLTLPEAPQHYEVTA